MGGANRGLSGALLHPSQPRVSEAFGELSSGTCAKIAPQTSPCPPLDTKNFAELSNMGTSNTKKL